MSEISEKHSEAARTNGAKSHGPITPEGKAKIAQNAIKHGLTSTNLLIQPEYQQSFEELNTALQKEVQPQGPIEQTLFDQLLFHGWKLRMTKVAEAELAVDAGGEILLSTDPEIMKRADRLRRYHSEHDRGYHRQLNQLKFFQNQRLYLAAYPQFLPKECPNLADKKQLAEQTHAWFEKQKRNMYKNATTAAAQSIKDGEA